MLSLDQSLPAFVLFCFLSLIPFSSVLFPNLPAREPNDFIHNVQKRNPSIWWFGVLREGTQQASLMRDKPISLELQDLV